MSYESYRSSDSSLAGLGCALIIFVGTGLLTLYCTVVTLFTDYTLWFLFNKNVPWYADFAIGFFSGPVLVPLTAVSFILDLCGLPAPLFRTGN